MNTITFYSTIDDFNSLDDYMFKEQTPSLHDSIEGFYTVSNNLIIATNKIPYHHIHKINNYFNQEFEIWF